MSAVVKCDRCGREIENPTPRDVLNVAFGEDGRVDVYVCPECEAELSRSKEERECIGCGRITDTACGLVGDAEYIISVLDFMGIPRYRAEMLLHSQDEPGKLPEGEIRRVFRICVGCAGDFNLRLDRGPYLRVGPASSPDNLPVFKQPAGSSPED